MVMPKRPLVGRTSGSTASGTPSRSHSGSDQAPARMSYSIVRLAFEGSVACTSPPVSFQSSQVSMVPTATSAEGSTPPSVKSHASLVPEK